MEVPPLSDQPTYSLVRGKEVRLTRQETLRVIPIQNSLEEEPSFSDVVNKISTKSPTFMEICSRLSNFVNTSFMRSGLLKELVLVFLLSKCNIASLTTADLYSRDVVLLKRILRSHPFGVANIMYTSVLHAWDRIENAYKFKVAEVSANSAIPNHPYLPEPRS